jgi:hypothetical protein
VGEKKKRGRPIGSKNKSQEVAASALVKRKNQSCELGSEHKSPIQKFQAESMNIDTMKEELKERGVKWENEHPLNLGLASWLLTKVIELRNTKC